MWVRQAEIDAGSRLGVSSDEAAELKRLKRENAELKRANVILRTASAFSADPHAVRAGGLGGSRANAPMVIRKHISRPKM
jgi:transposase-like protein